MALSTLHRRADETVETHDDDSGDAAESAGISLGAALGLILAVAGFFVGSRVIDDNSFFTHLVNGRLVLEGYGIPRVDPYSYTAAGQKVTVQSWLATVIYAWLEATFGGASLRLLGGVLAATLTLALWKLTETIEQVLPRLAFVGLAIAVGGMMWGPRPTMFGLLGFAGLLLVQRGSLPMWSLVPIMWLWVNTHGSFPLGLVAIGAIGLGHAIDRHERPDHELRVFAWAFGGMVLGAINPLGVDLLRFPIHLMGRREALLGVAEWSPPAFDQPLGLAVIVIMMLHLVAAARGARWKALLPGAVFVVASLLAVRNLAPGTLVFASSLAPYLSIGNGSLTARTKGLVPGALTVVAVLGGCLGILSVSASDAFRLDEYPVEAVDWLDARSLVADPDVHIVHRDTVGNYLELRFGADASVFVDDRFDFFPLELLRQHRTLFFGGDYRAILDGHDADVVLWEADDGFAHWLDEASDWHVAYRDDAWLIACRVDSDAAARSAS